MGNKSKKTEGKRYFKAAGIGLAVAALTFCVYVAPPLARAVSAERAASIHQDNLVSGRGLAADSFALADISLTILLDGTPHPGMSFSTGQGFWQVPQDGQLELQLAPGPYTLTAGFDNRKLEYDCEIEIGAANRFVLDVGKVPDVPEYSLLEVTQSGGQALSLGITDADEVSTYNMPDSMAISKIDGEYHLLLDTDKISIGFTGMRVDANNEHGTAVSYVFVRLPRDEAVTEIRTVEDLKAVRGNLSGNYRLMNDLDMSAVDDWLPIGTDAYPFTGTFDGGGHEISGFHATPNADNWIYFGFFGAVSNAEITNLIFREPVVTPEVPSRELGIDYASAVIAGNAADSLLVNCASIGGIVSPSDGRASGLFGGTTSSLVLGCFNSTGVYCNMINRYLPNTGGISGGSSAYHAYNANEGDVKGNHETGGISGWGITAYFTCCINSGFISGPTLVGAWTPGGIVLSNDNGWTVNSLFVRGQSPNGGHSLSGFVSTLRPIEWEDLRNPSELSLIGSFEGDEPDWAYASLDAQGPVPYGVFKDKAPVPEISRSANTIDIYPVDGLLYYYTLDGSDPHAGSTEPVESLHITLKQGQTLQVFAAKQGCRDSETITTKGGA